MDWYPYLSLYTLLSFIRNKGVSIVQPPLPFRPNQREPCQAAAQTSSKHQTAPNSGRVSSVSAITEAAATATITTHLKTASSEILTFLPSSLSH